MLYIVFAINTMKPLNRHPLTRQKVAETLSYFTASEIPIGAIVVCATALEVIHAIVAESRPASEMKSDCRSASTRFAKLSKVKATAFFPRLSWNCRTLSDITPRLLERLLPPLRRIILENAHKIISSDDPCPCGYDETYVVQGDDEDRMSSWAQLVRQEFARKKS